MEWIVVFKNSFTQLFFLLDICEFIGVTLWWLYGKWDLYFVDGEKILFTIVSIKAIRNFNTPVILLTKDNNYEYNEEYKKIGFSDYILKPLKKDNLLEKINEYGKKDNSAK